MMKGQQGRRYERARRAAMALLVAGALSLGGADAAEPAFDLAVHGGGGGGGTSGSGGGGGGGGGYVAYREGGIVTAYKFGGGGHTGVGSYGGGGSIGGGGGGGYGNGMNGSGGDSGAFYGGSHHASGGKGDGGDVADGGDSHINSGSGVGASPSSSGAFPSAFTVSTSSGGSPSGNGGDGGDAQVTASGNVTLNRLTLVSGENGGNAYGGAGGSGGTATFTAQAGLSAKTITTSGAVNLTVDSLISKKGFKLTATGAPNTLSISSYVFDLTGAENGSVLLDIDGITGLPAPSGSVSFGGLPGGLYVGDKITLIDEGLDGTAWSQTGVSVAGCTLTVTKQGTKLTAEVTAKSKFSGGSGGGGGCDAGFGLLGVVALLGLAAARGRR